PQTYFVEGIAGDALEVEVMVEPGESPETYEPKPSQLQMLEDAELFLAIGVPFERAFLDSLRDWEDGPPVVDVSSGIVKLPMADHTHSHSESTMGGEEHPDPHIWLSPSKAEQIAANTLEALAAAYPDNAEAFERNYNALLEEIRAVDAELSEVLAGSRGSSFMVYHPAWGYFADDYGLKQLAVEIGGQEPSPAELMALQTEASANRAEFLLISPQHNERGARALAERINVDIMEADPLSEDWAENLIAVGRMVANRAP
ncbi:MAG: metal ABC transporter solute-binding protein, Zn/Mn family, partial [Fimbriimonadaceae bacterium]